MSLEIFVDAYSGYRANERPQRFTVDKEVYEIASIEDQWRTPDAMLFKVRSTEDKQYLLRYDERTDQWTLQSGFDGDALLVRPSIELISVEPKAIREAESKIAGCERCRPEQAEIPFDWIIAEVLDKRGQFEFVLTETARCPECGGELSEKTLVEPQGGIEFETSAGMRK
ncbi:MAG TPA: hypothetical protein VE422_00915 [Terriglobia bacterium]|nr:hypothetical protein [Terriglobia bacterium]